MITIKYEDKILTTDIQRKCKTDKGNYIIAYKIAHDDVGVSISVYLSNDKNNSFSRQTYVPEYILFNRTDLILILKASDITRTALVENDAMLKKEVFNTFIAICNVFVVTASGI